MCKYCEGEERIARFGDKNVMYIYKGELSVSKDGNTTYSVDVNYCPMCGRKIDYIEQEDEE